ncbi:MAG: hypothetical protein WKF90_04430 [Pyrinomonadaceae bacterium]
MSKIIFALALVALAITSVTAQAQTSHYSLGTNVNIDGTIWYITVSDSTNCKTAYTSAGAFLSYGFKFRSDVASSTKYERALPVCQQNEVESGHGYGYGKFLAPQVGKIVCSDRGSDKGTCYVMARGGYKVGFANAQVFKDLGYSFLNTVSADVSWMKNLLVINSASTGHYGPINFNGTVKMSNGSDGFGVFPDLATLYSYGYTLDDVKTANEADWNSHDTLSYNQEVIGHRQKGQLTP